MQHLFHVTFYILRPLCSLLILGSMHVLVLVVSDAKQLPLFSVLRYLFSSSYTLRQSRMARSLCDLTRMKSIRAGIRVVCNSTYNQHCTSRLINLPSLLFLSAHQRGFF